MDKATVNQFYEDIKKYFDLTYSTTGFHPDWIQSRAEDIAEMTETWYVHADSGFVSEANGLMSYLNGYLHGMDDFNSLIASHPDEYTEAMADCKTFDDFVNWMHKEVTQNDN